MVFFSFQIGNGAIATSRIEASRRLNRLERHSKKDRASIIEIDIYWITARQLQTRTGGPQHQRFRRKWITTQELGQDRCIVQIVPAWFDFLLLFCNNLPFFFTCTNRSAFVKIVNCCIRCGTQRALGRTGESLKRYRHSTTVRRTVDNTTLSKLQMRAFTYKVLLSIYTPKNT